MKAQEITYVTHNLSIGGSQKVIINLANEALKLNYIVNIIVLVNDLYLLTNISSSPNLRVYTCIDLPISKGFYNRLIIGNNLFKILRRIKPAFVHSHLWQIDVFYLLLLKWFTKVRVVHTIHSPGGAYFMDSFSHRLNVYIERAALNLFGKIDLIVVSEETEGVVRKILRYKDTCHLIPNGIDTDSFKHLDNDDEILKEERVYFVFPSRYQTSKGHVLLLQAFEMLLQVHPEVYLVLIGIGLEENLSGVAENLNITDRTIFYGPTNKIDKVLSRCQFGVFPSQYEGHPIALCEMMAAGLAIVASDIPANKFVSNNGQGAFLFKHDSAYELFIGMRTVLENAGYANHLRTKAVGIVTEQFSAIKMFQLHSDLYNKSN
uniref:glycosyltransferase family 4 protein n=1 Tax=Algoriphagus sp. TaxID=1872435 RepID=UPI004047F10A